MDVVAENFSVAPEPVVAGRGISAGTKAGRAIQTALTGFYQSAFADPSLWGQDLPSAAWDVFASDVRTRAQRDADTLTLGTLGRGVERLTFTRKDLVVRVLIDQSGRAEAALATVTVEADANTTDGIPAALSRLASVPNGTPTISERPTIVRVEFSIC